jgi:lactate racemase
MKLYYPYPGYQKIEQPVEIPESQLMGIFQPLSKAELNIEEGEERIVERAMREPIGSPPINQLLNRQSRVLILIDDQTRRTPVPIILRTLVKEFEEAMVPDEKIRILTAPGTHREMTEQELREKLGEFYGRFGIHQHHWLLQEELRNFGQTSDGVSITANKLLADADFVVGLGSIVPHRVKGFSGGAKIAFPGVSGREMMEKNQWEASIRMSETVMGTAENPMRLRMEEAARRIGLHTIINIVCDRDNRIAGCFVGDVVKAHRAGCALAHRIYAVELHERAEIVLTDAYPADRDFWQSAKGFYSGIMAVKRGGTLIVVAPNPEGIAENHPNLLEIGYRPHPEIIRMVEQGKVDDIVGAAILGDMAQIIDQADCILVSPGVDRRDVEKLGMRYAETPQKALSMALRRQGRDSRLVVLRHGGHILPLVDTGLRGERRKSTLEMQEEQAQIGATGEEGIRAGAAL